MSAKATNKPVKEVPKAPKTDEKTTVLGKTPKIVPNTPEIVAPNPVPATERDTPVLIQYSAPEPGPAPVADAAPAAENKGPAIEAVKEVVSAALDAVSAAAEPVATGKTTTIKVLRTHPKLGAFAGEETTINSDFAEELIAGGFAEAK